MDGDQGSGHEELKWSLESRRMLRPEGGSLNLARTTSTSLFHPTPAMQLQQSRLNLTSPVLIVIRIAPLIPVGITRQIYPSQDGRCIFTLTLGFRPGGSQIFRVVSAPPAQPYVSYNRTSG